MFSGMAIKFNCKRCGHEWESKLGRMFKSKKPRIPKSCPKCKSYSWDKEKQ
jgi:NAD-dependent SIR2 family protein deacetylase